MGRTSASTIVPGRLAEVEDLWYDRHRWPSWVDGFGHVVKLEGDWPEASVPHPDWMDERRAAEALRDSGKTRIFFRPRFEP